MTRRASAGAVAVWRVRIGRDGCGPVDGRAGEAAIGGLVRYAEQGGLGPWPARCTDAPAATASPRLRLPLILIRIGSSGQRYVSALRRL